MTSAKILAIIQAGGAGGRMDVLTTERPKPVLRFGGSYRLIDFVLSNLMHSRLNDVWLSVSYQGASVVEAVRNGRAWDLDRTYGGLRFIGPQEGFSPHESGMSGGNADELYMLRDRIRAEDPDIVLVLSADHAYRLDYRELIDTHLTKGAEVTLLSTDISGLDGAKASDHAVLEVNRLGRVTGFDYKPESPTSDLIAAEAIAYDASVMIEVLEQLHREVNAVDRGEEETPGLGDYGDLLLPRLVERGKAYAHQLDGYWRDLGQPHHYLNAHLELVREQTDLFDPAWPVIGHQPQTLPARIEQEAEVHESLISPGCVVGGRVTRSVLAPGVVIEPGADVMECVIGDGVRIRAGAKAWRSIIDHGAELGPDARVGSQDTDLDDPDAVAVIGRESTVDSVLPAGARLFPGTTA